MPRRLQALTPEERDLCLRYRLVALPGNPAAMRFAAVTPAALEAARRFGLRVIARIDPTAFADAFAEVLAPAVLDDAVHGLARAHPELSACRRFTLRQHIAALYLALALVVALRFADGTRIVLTLAILAAFFFGMMVSIRILALASGRTHTYARVPRLAVADLPVYTVLVPLFRETAVLAQLITGLRALRYPPERLDIKLILEEEDMAMRHAVAALPLEPHFEIITVPAGRPQTKPRALNYALAFARGELLTIYDSEDIPEPGQLIHAASIFARRGHRLACLQAVLTFYNPDENWLTRQFTAEYAALFNVILPWLAAAGLPLPLGGTSNHFRTEALLAVGAWDPYNVTEDADLGYRFTRMGYDTDAFGSKTYEEANTRFWNWLRQRQRWLKGFLHTWLVLMRTPRLLWRQVGTIRFLVIQCMSLGVFATALLYPFLFIHAFWLFASSNMLERLKEPVHAAMIAFYACSFLAGYGASMACASRGLKRLGYFNWHGTVAAMPIYWLLMTPAAWLALRDFIVRPHHWHKTEHGISAVLKPAAPRKRRSRGRVLNRAS
ncbi:MAG: glycosyltransferase [Rhizobiales bacterium]|nr:glycosyltransferase [Hyphomicrobiales bacterium]